MSETQIALVTHEYLDSLRNLQSTKETHHVTGNTTISATHTVIIEEFNEDVLENDEIIANAKRLLRDGCGCSHGMKGALCCPQFLEKLLLSNQNNCLELTCAELDLVILANIQQAVAKIDFIGEKRKERLQCSFLFQNIPICKDMIFYLYGLSYSRFHTLKEHCEQNRLSPKQQALTSQHTTTSGE